MDILRASACDLGRAIGEGRADPVEIAEAYLGAARAHPELDRIYTCLTPDRALAEARAASERAKNGTRRGLLDGVPLSWKDLFDTAGVATEAGSKLLEGRVPERDAVVLERATRAGLVCLGKTHMSELAFSGLGLNPKTATSPNRNDPAWVPGGSSSGSAASVAFDLAPGTVGSDTGGSVRVPAAYNDLVGLKTTEGRITLEGVVPLAPTFDTVGPLTRTVEDAAEIFAVLDGSPPVDLRGSSLKGRDFLLLEPYASDVRAESKAGFEAAVEKLTAAGARVETIAIPEVEEAMDLATLLFSAEAYGTWRDVIEAAPDKMFARILERFRGGAAFSAADFVAGWQKLRRLRARWLELTAHADAVLLPTAPNLPPDRERLMTDSEYYVTENLLTLRNTRVGNLMGLSGITLPTGVPSCGIMFLTPPMAEARALRLAAAAEAALTR